MSHRSSLFSVIALAGALAAASVLSPRTAAAQQVRPHPAYDRDLPKALLEHVKITEDSAAKIAQARVMNGTIRGVELERERGKLIYSYELKVPHRSGIEEVNIDAMTGAIVNIEHESPESEHGGKR